MGVSCVQGAELKPLSSMPMLFRSAQPFIPFTEVFCEHLLNTRPYANVPACPWGAPSWEGRPARRQAMSSRCECWHGVCVVTVVSRALPRLKTVASGLDFSDWERTRGVRQRWERKRRMGITSVFLRA